MDPLRALQDRLRQVADRDDVESLLALVDGAAPADRRALAAWAAGLRDADWSERRSGDPLLAGALLPSAAAAAALVWAGESGARIARWRGEDFARRWAEEVCRGIVRHGRCSSWLAVRAAVREGWLPAPEHQGYRLGLLDAGSRSGTRIELLRADPELLGEPLFELFALEGTRELSFANADKYVKRQGTWLEALVELAGTGELDRVRLLREALDALQRDFPAYRATWFGRLYEALEPNVADRAAHVGAYLRLIGSRIPQVQAIGVKALQAAAKAGVPLRFEQLAELEPAWTARQKTVVCAAIGLASALGETVVGERRAEVASAVARALHHGLADVQLAAFRALQALGLPVLQLQELLAPSLERLAPRVRKAVERAMAIDSAAPEATPPPVAAPLVPVPGRGEAVAPIASFDELVRELTALVGGADDPLVLERCLDGIVRLPGPRPPDFARRTAGVRRLAERSGPQRFQRFVTAWLHGQAMAVHEESEGPERRVSCEQPLQGRLREVLESGHLGLGLPLLALPTASPFAVAAEVLLQRLDAWGQAGRTPLGHDLDQALRRVPPAQRTELLPRLSPRVRAVAEVAFAAAPPVTLVVRTEWRELRDGGRYRRQIVEWTLPARGARHPLLDFAREVEAAPWWGPDEFETGLLLRALGGLAPHDGELLSALGVRRIGPNVDGDAVARHDVAFLEPLLLPTAACGPAACLLLGVALGARAPEMHGIAIDVVLQALAERRLAAVDLARAMRLLFECRFVPCARWARSLRTVAVANPDTGRAVAAVLEGTLAGPVADVVREVGSLLELLADLGAEVQHRVEAAEAVEFLRAVAATGSGKAARLARDLLA